MCISQQAHVLLLPGGTYCIFPNYKLNHKWKRTRIGTLRWSFCVKYFLRYCLTSLYQPILKKLTHWGRDKVAAIFQTTFSNAFSWMKMYEFRLRFHGSLFQRVQFINIITLGLIENALCASCLVYSLVYSHNTGQFIFMKYAYDQVVFDYYKYAPIQASKDCCLLILYS